jgi:hypothetical protein
MLLGYIVDCRTAACEQTCPGKLQNQRLAGLVSVMQTHVTINTNLSPLLKLQNPL